MVAAVSRTRRILEAEWGGELRWGEPRLLLAGEGLRGMIDDAGGTGGHGHRNRAD